jgi:hypothetical protein
MPKTNSGTGTLIPLLRDDGTVYFRPASRPIDERLCEWAVSALWALMLAVIVGTLAWS